MKERIVYVLVSGVLIAGLLVFLFDRRKPGTGTPRPAGGDEARIADLRRIQSALDQYVKQVGPLPTPAEYGEGAGTSGFWEGWWDLSSDDGDKDGVPFLDFLVEGGILPAVPVHPVNKAAAPGEPRGGQQYVYFLVPPGYDYAGGTCDTAAPNRWHYMVALTGLENKSAARTAAAGAPGSGCQCLWRDAPNFFQQHFDYVLCGSFDATPEARARAAEVRARLAATAQARQQQASFQQSLPQDQRRVADLLAIQKGLQQYLEKVGPLPAPGDYGEAESSSAGFWNHYWDMSAGDGDGDGKPFLDFLVDSGVMPAVPVDPENDGAKDGDPRSGRQYVYFVASPDESYGGGTCGRSDRKWVYLLGITDLRTEVTRPPANLKGSGCDCLWRDQPNFFQHHFDYVVCGTFDATSEGRARVAALLRKQASEDAAEKAQSSAGELQKYVPQDQRRVADLHEIQKGLQAYIEKVGRLPAPGEYGEAETWKNAGFWHHYWDVSTEDGDGDGHPFLDFLVESKTMTTVPVDPENQAAPDGDPRGGRQYVYFVASPTDKYQGGSCADEKHAVYMLGITDLRSEATRPPAKITGSGCECLWRDVPNFFQTQFDYVLCGTFPR